MQEVRKQVELNNTMTLLDLNGTIKSFKSEFIISSKNPTRKYLIAIVTQDQLDKGDIQYVLSEQDGKFSRKVSYHLPEHLNHFLAIKKEADDKNEEPLICDVYIRLTEESPIDPEEETKLYPIRRADLEEKAQESKSILKESLSEEMRNELTKEIYEKYVLENLKNSENTEGTNIFTVIGSICIVSVILLLVWKSLNQNKF
jgi:hypothetical protein